MDESEIRAAIVAFSRKAVAQGLSEGTSGNISVRHGQGMLITPSGVAPEAMQADQIVEIGPDGSTNGGWKPSSEWALHARLYAARPEARAIVHAHPPHCVALSCLREPMPPFHYMIAAFGGDEVPCAPYATFGTEALAETVAVTMGARYHACLMANHGMIALGADLESAYQRAETVETLARQYHLARTMGRVVLLSSDEMAAAHAAFGSYGYGRPGMTDTASRARAPEPGQVAGE